jgi:hypothetical protein
MPETETPCAQCGSLVESGSIFCRKCGLELRPPQPLIQSRADDGKIYVMSPITRVVVTVVKAIAAIAAVVAIFCPLGSWAQIVTFVGSVVLLVVCQVILSNLDDTYIDENKNHGYWPAKPKSWNKPPDDRHNAGNNADNSPAD